MDWIYFEDEAMHMPTHVCAGGMAEAVGGRGGATPSLSAYTHSERLSLFCLFFCGSSGIGTTVMMRMFASKESAAASASASLTLKHSCLTTNQQYDATARL
jgi:hypothetical protein